MQRSICLTFKVNARSRNTTDVAALVAEKIYHSAYLLTNVLLIFPKIPLLLIGLQQNSHKGKQLPNTLVCSSKGTGDRTDFQLAKTKTITRMCWLNWLEYTFLSRLLVCFPF